MRNTVWRVLVLAVATLLVAFPGRVLAGSSCGGDGSLKVMTLNLLFSELEERDARLDEIARFMVDEDVDVALLQEVVGGVLSGTFNAAVDLRARLSAEGQHYNLSYRMANGIPGLLSVGNAILSRCHIRFTVSKTLPFVSEEVFEGIEIPLKRRTMMSRLWVDGLGSVNVYNNHLCAFCSPEDRRAQAEVAYRFVLKLEALIPGYNPIIVGGDFNTLYGSDLYDDIATLFVDAFDQGAPVATPCADDSLGGACTYGLPGNPFVPDPPEDHPPVRIDYLFLHGLAADESEVAFDGLDDPYGYVSDHSAVVTSIPLP